MTNTQKKYKNILVGNSQETKPQDTEQVHNQHNEVIKSSRDRTIVKVEDKTPDTILNQEQSNYMKVHENDCKCEDCKKWMDKSALNQELAEKQEQIDNAVRIFKETLEKTYKDDMNFYGIGTHSLQNFFCGKVSVGRLNNGNLRISGEISKDAINKDCKGLPFKFTDWDIYPLVITLFNKDIGEKC